VRRRGFTIIEMVVVISLIGILAAMLFPIFARGRETARSTQCLANVAELGMALRMYAEDWGGAYPPQEDNLAPIAARVRTEVIFRCPSAQYSGPTLEEQEIISKAKRAFQLDTMKPVPRIEAPAQIGPGMGEGRGGDGRGGGMRGGGGGRGLGRGRGGGGGGMGMGRGGVPTAYFGQILADGVLYGSNYYYHAGATNESRGDVWLVTERELVHLDRAHVLYAAGNVKALPEPEWRKLVPARAIHTPEDYGEEYPR